MPKTAMLLRWGAFGDIVMATTALRVLKEDGYRITVNITKRGLPILRNNPCVDEVVVYEDNTISQEKLEEYWGDLAKRYDKFINLSESIEGSLLKVEGREEFNWPKEKRHEACNVNYYDRTLEIAGYGHIKGRNGELYFTPFEERMARDYRKKYKGKFLVLWSLSGSSMHKTYPFTEYVANEFLARHPDAMILTVGDAFCEVLEWSHPQVKNYSNKWPIRKSLIMTKYTDLVIGTETGILNASGCFETPKIVLLSHSTHENLSKYWKNAYPVHADVSCYPCHQLHYTLRSCPIDEQLRSPMCMAKLKAINILNAMEDVYTKWKEKRDGAFCRQREQALLCC